LSGFIALGIDDAEGNCSIEALAEPFRCGVHPDDLGFDDTDSSTYARCHFNHRRLNVERFGRGQGAFVRQATLREHHEGLMAFQAGDL
jgi:hypothetical protein